MKNLLIILTALTLLSCVEKADSAGKRAEKIYTFDYSKNIIDESSKIDSFIADQDFELEQYLQSISRQDFLNDSLQFKNSVTQRKSDFNSNVLQTSYGKIKFPQNINENADSSIKYSYAGYAEPVRSHLLNVELYEGEGTLLVNDDRYRNTVISGFPYFSPDKKYFITYKDNEGTSSQLSIYSIQNEEFKHYKTLWSETNIVEYATWDKKGDIALQLRSVETGHYSYAKISINGMSYRPENEIKQQQDNLNHDWKGVYTITTKALSNYNQKEIDIVYTLSITSKDSGVLSIGAEQVQDYRCEGSYHLTVENNLVHASGKCDEDDINDFYIKFGNGKYYIKSKRFLNQDWQELTKE